MRTFIYIAAIIFSLTSLTSCHTYGVIAENDVYIQGPSQLNIAEDPNDMTSFNAFRAGRDGRFNTQYNSPRMRNSMYMGFGSPMMWGYDPFYDPFRMNMGFGGMYGYNPYGFHGMHPGWGYGGFGWNNHFGWGYPHGGFGWGHHHGMHGWAGSGWGMHGWGHPGMHGWGHPGMHGWGHPGSSWGTNTGSVASTPKNMFRGPRQSVTARSARSSGYPGTLQGLQSSPTPPTQISPTSRIQGSTTSRVNTTRAVPSGQFARPTSAQTANVRVANNNINRNPAVGATSTRATTSVSNRATTPTRTAAPVRGNTYHASPGAIQRGTISPSQNQRSTGFSSSPSRGTIQGTPTNRGMQSSPSRGTRPASPNNSQMRGSSGFNQSGSRSPAMNSRTNSGFSSGSNMSRGSSSMSRGGSSGMSRGSSGGRSSGSSFSGGRR